jgi:WD40 repeat protein
MAMLRKWLLAAVTAVLLRGADARREIWRLDLAKFVNDRKELSTVVWGISFSPDESKVAIGFGPFQGLDAAPQRVVIVSVDSPSVALREFDVSLKNYLVSTFAWAPSGTALVVGDFLSKAVMLSTGKEPSCNFPEPSHFGGFLSDGRMAITINEAEIQILRPDCSLLANWKTAAGTRVLDTSPKNDLIVTLSNSADGSYAIELVSSRQEVRRRWLRNAEEGGLHFADQGRMLCGGYLLTKDRYPRVNVGCWDTQSGAIIAKNINVTLSNSSIRSSDAGLLAITDYDITVHTGKIWQLLGVGGESITPRRRVIWDVRSGKEIATWTGPTIKPNFTFALSPNGRYYAEGGSGSLSVYSLQP